MSEVEKISERCGYSSPAKMEEEMGIPPGTLLHATLLMQNLISVGREEEKNVLYLDMQDGVPVLNVLFIKECDIKLMGERIYEEPFPLIPGKEEDTFHAISMQMIKMSRDWDAVTDIDLNTLYGGPFFPTDVKLRILDRPVGDGAIWFGQYGDQDLAMMMASMGGLVKSSRGDA